MNQHPKTTKKPKTEKQVQVSDLKPNKDPQAGIIAILIDAGPTTMSLPKTK